MIALDLTGKDHKKVDSKKVQLPLNDDEKVSSAQSIPKLKLDEPNQTVGDLSTKLAEVYTNPIFDAMKKLDDDRKKLLSISGEQWHDSFSQKKLEELQGILGNSSISAAFKTAQDYSAYAKPILESLSSKHFDSLQKLLGVDYQAYLKPEYSQAFSAITQLGNTLQSPSIQKTLSEIMGTHSYLPQLGESITKLSHNEDLFKATQNLNDIEKYLHDENFKQKMEDHATANLQIKPIDISSFEIKMPIIEQNNKLIEAATLQNSMLKDIYDQMQIQNSHTDRTVKELERQNEQIEDQIEQKEYEIESNSEATKYTLRIAIASIIISIIVSGISIWATYDVYRSEDIAGNKDHVELLKAIKESSSTVNLAKELQYQKDVNTLQQQQMIQLNQEVEQLKIYLNGKRQ